MMESKKQAGPQINKWQRIEIISYTVIVLATFLSSFIFKEQLYQFATFGNQNIFAIFNLVFTLFGVFIMFRLKAIFKKKGRRDAGKL